MKHTEGPWHYFQTKADSLGNTVVILERNGKYHDSFNTIKEAQEYINSKAGYHDAELPYVEFECNKCNHRWNDDLSGHESFKCGECGSRVVSAHYDEDQQG